MGDNVKCYGNETDLRDCNHKAGDNCKNDETICLLGGTPGSGNVYYQGKPVCHNGWDFPDANVVCKALGFAAAVNFTIRSHFGLSNTYFPDMGGTVTHEVDALCMMDACWCS